jgi:hypothetical protein
LPRNPLITTRLPRLRTYQSAGRFADKIQAQLGNRIAKPGGNTLDLLVASGIGLPAMVYGSVLFLNYTQ